MLNLRSKKEVQDQILSNQSTFDAKRDVIVAATRTRDSAYIDAHLVDVIKEHLMLSLMVRDYKPLSFTLPLMEITDPSLTEDEVSQIENYYYDRRFCTDEDGTYLAHQTGGMICALLEEKIGQDMYFKEYTLDKKTKTIRFDSVPLLAERVKKSKVQKQLTEFIQTIDQTIAKVFELKVFAKRINHLYELLSGIHPVAVLEDDLSHYPIVSINVKEKVNSVLVKKYRLPEDCKINFDVYLKESLACKKLKKAVLPYGYSVQMKAKRFNEQWYTDGFTLVLEPAAAAKGTVTTPVMPHFSEVKHVFDQKRAEYEGLMEKRIDKEHKRLTDAIDAGVQDAFVAKTFSKISTLEHRLELSRTIFPKHKDHPSYWGDRAYIRFDFDLDRQFENLQPMERDVRNVRGVGVRYLNRSQNVMTHLCKRYPFLAAGKKHITPSSDHCTWSGALGSGEEVFDEKTLTFSFEIESKILVKHIGAVISFLNEHYGTMDLSTWMDEVGFNDEGITTVINDYLATAPHGKFEIPLTTVSHEKLEELYTEAPYTEMLRAKMAEEIEGRFLGGFYGENKVKQDGGFTSLRYANLFCASLYTHERFNAIKTALSDLGYTLQVITSLQESERIDTGRTSLHKTPIIEDVVLKYQVKLMIE